jgi:DNA-binding MarR family transcriptional regulator
MKEVTETMIYDMAFRVRLYIASKLSEEKRLNDLSEREALILELIGTKCSMSISEIGNFYPKVSNSTISTTITKLWKDKKLVDKNILPENQRITTVNLTEKGRTVLEQIKKSQSAVFNTVTTSLGLSVEQSEAFQEILKDAIGYFDEMLGLELNGSTAVAA